MPRVRKSAIRRRLFRSSPHCHYCGVLTVLDSPDPKNKYLPDNLATIEHLRTRLDSDRQEPFGNEEWKRGERRLVNACRKCNQEQGIKRHNELPLEELHRRSGRFPRNQGAA